MVGAASSSSARSTCQAWVQLTLGGQRCADKGAAVAEPELDEESHSSSSVDAARRPTGTSNRRAVALTAIHRQRKEKRKPPEGPRGRSKMGRSTKETRVKMADRLEQFPDQGLAISGGKLFCQACREEQPNLKESLKKHFLTAKHISRLAKLRQSMSSSQQISTDLAQHFEMNKDLQGVSISVRCPSSLF